MADTGHEETEKIIAIMARRLRREYKRASEEVEAKLKDYMRRYDAKDEIWRQWVKEGKETQEDYIKWRTGQILISKRWEEMRDTLAQDYHNVNEIAKSIVNGYMPEVYALNHNYGTYQVEHEALVNTSYTLYSRETVERMMREDPEMLPPPGKKVSKRIAAGLDVRWNRQQIQSVMTQAVLQGESIPKIAHRLAKTVGDRNYGAAVRNARTMATGAQNAGRVDSYKRAEDMGIELEQAWVATFDMRTRHSHRVINGESIKVGGVFSNGCRYPGDPEGPPNEIYNCRCTLVSQLKGFEINLKSFEVRNDPQVGGMTYEEWVADRTEKTNSITLPADKARNIRQSYINKYRKHE